MHLHHGDTDFDISDALALRLLILLSRFGSSWRRLWPKRPPSMKPDDN
jgi:hypothetical protein